MKNLASQYTVLVVDDVPTNVMLVQAILKKEGYTLLTTDSGTKALRIAQEKHPNLILLDIMMPELDGFSAVREIRTSSEVPIIMLSARGEEYDKINGFGLGIDDYVVKPFSPKELMMRVDAVMKRYRRAASAVPDGGKPHEIVELDGGGLKADITARLVYIDGERVDMSPKEYDLFFYLLANRNIALSREQLLREVWGYDFYGDARTLDTHIKLLRKSLGRYADCVVTLRGVGYRFESALANGKGAAK